MLIGANYHYIRKDFSQKYQSIFGVNPKQFEDQLKEIAKYGKFVSQNDIRFAILEGKKLPRNSIIVTFDDGLREQYDLALPILKKLGIPAIFFVCSRPTVEMKILNVHRIHLLRSLVSPMDILNSIKDFLTKRDVNLIWAELHSIAEKIYRYDSAEHAIVKYVLNFVLSKMDQEVFLNEAFPKLVSESEEVFFKDLYMTSDQIKDLANWDFLGIHGHDHTPLGDLKSDELDFQITKSKQIIEELTNTEMDSFSYPHGTFQASNGLATKLKNAKYNMAFTMERGINSDLEMPFYISRFDTNDLPFGKSYKFESNNFFNLLPKKKWTFELGQF